MAAYTNEKKQSLKIMVDMKAKKVVFAEAEKDFVDFIFQLVSLPLAAVTKMLQLNGKEMVGCHGDLCNSIQNLDARYFQQNTTLSNCLSILRPSAVGNVTLLSLHERYVNRPKSCVKEGVVYMVMDNLEVKPMSISLIKSPDINFDDLVAKQVQVGLQEGLAILKASLETKAVLTTVFYEKI